MDDIISAMRQMGEFCFYDVDYLLIRALQICLSRESSG